MAMSDDEIAAYPHQMTREKPIDALRSLERKHALLFAAVLALSAETAAAHHQAMPHPLKTKPTACVQLPLQPALASAQPLRLLAMLGRLVMWALAREEPAQPRAATGSPQEDKDP